MEKRYFLTGAVLFMITSLSLMARAPASAAEVSLVKIQPVGEEKFVGLYLDPPILTVAKNTIVVWLSGVEGEGMQRCNSQSRCI